MLILFIIIFILYVIFLDYIFLVTSLCLFCKLTTKILSLGEYTNFELNLMLSCTRPIYWLVSHMQSLSLYIYIYMDMVFMFGTCCWSYDKVFIVVDLFVGLVVTLII